VQGDRGPHRVDILLPDAVAAQKIPRGIGAVHFEALLGAAVQMGQAHVVEHRAGVKQFGVELQAATLARKRTPKIHPARMVKQQRRFGVPHQLGYFARELAVGNFDARNIGIHRRPDIHCTSPAD
jgi:hypothetical protein